MKEPRDFERIIVTNQGGAPVYLNQVADVVDGEAEITISGEPHLVKAGDVLLLPAGEPHAIKAITPFKMMLIMIKE